MKRLNRLFILALGGLLPLVLSSCIGPCGFSWPGESSVSDTLPASKYDAAEAVYRYFLPGGQWPDSKTNFVYCLSFGVGDDGMPADFLTRFSEVDCRVVARSGQMKFQRGLILDAKTGQPIAMLELQSLSIYNGQARARFVYVTGSMHVTETLRLSQQDGRWKITQIKENERAYQ